MDAELQAWLFESTLAVTVALLLVLLAVTELWSARRRARKGV